MARSIDDDIVFGFKAPLLSGFFILFRDEYTRFPCERNGEISIGIPHFGGVVLLNTRTRQ
tara:strand:- start:1117 stop:1296 length:180 start_codon:yes stop_codon:yes gene_type:complete